MSDQKRRRSFRRVPVDVRQAVLQDVAQADELRRQLVEVYSYAAIGVRHGGLHERSVAKIVAQYRADVAAAERAPKQ
jgi:hypothetical protein